jgi:hypothetical protein
MARQKVRVSNNEQSPMVYEQYTELPNLVMW